MPTEPHGPLLKVCSLLNAESAEYIVVGAWALILNNVIRATEDVDILIAENAENLVEGAAGGVGGGGRQPRGQPHR